MAKHDIRIAESAHQTQHEANTALQNISMEQAIQLAISYAIEYHKAGNLTQAEEFYLKVLEVDPDNVEVNHLLGLLSHMNGNNTIAIQLYRKAIELNPDFAEANYNLGIVLQELGRLGEAVISYRKALSIKPDYVNAMSNLGVALQEMGELDEAIESFKNALYIKPDYVSVIYNLGNTLNESGHIKEAIASYQKALTIKPDYLEVYNNLGNAFKDLGLLEKAIASYQQALQIKPDYPEALNNLGCVYKEQGLIQKALDCYHQALSIKPDFAAVYNNICSAMIEMGQLKKAVDNCNKALNIDPDYVDAHFNLGVVLEKQGHPQQAIACYRKTIALNQNYAEGYNNLGIVLKETGKLDEAIECYRKALAIKPDYAKPYINFSELIKGRSFESRFIEKSHGLKELISACLSRNDIDHRDLVEPALSILYSKNKLNAVISYLEDELSEQDQKAPDEIDFSIIENTELISLLQDKLFHKLLKKTVINDELSEYLLQKIRQNILIVMMSCGSKKEKAQLIEQLNSFVYSLAIQCYWNEYIYFQTDEEEKALIKLTENLQNAFQDAEPLTNQETQFYSALFACYSPLTSLPFAQQHFNKVNYQLIQQQGESGRSYFELIDIQFRRPLLEKEISSSLAVLTDIDDETSKKVQQQYEQNPYPRWTGIYHHTPQRFIDYLRHEVYPNKLDQIQSLEKPEVLVAGCGTGYQPITIGQAYKGSSVLAIDLSLASLSYAKRKTDEIGMSNIEFAQADLLNLSSLGKQFDIIECSGVLHHMHDPVKGWKILLNHLKPNGFMRIGLHSQISRKNIITIKTLLAECGFLEGEKIEEIRKARQVIFSLDRHHLARQVVNSPDFYSASAVRDLIFHVKEHYFMLSEIAQLLDDMELSFLGFVSEKEVKHRYLEKYPQDKNATSLLNWEQFEQKNANTFANMYQFWVQKK